MLRNKTLNLMRYSYYVSSQINDNQSCFGYVCCIWFIYWAIKCKYYFFSWNT